jgi:hypothetical protein
MEFWQEPQGPGYQRPVHDEPILPLVNVDRLPLAELVVWGRDRADAWWALVIWSSRSGDAARHSAWVPASTVRRAATEDGYRDVPRLQLAADDAQWPAPAARAGTTLRHHGASRDPGSSSAPR